ncbi:MAG: transglutaminase family protein [Kiritimatiellae bacterium]|nr:transglutaminase family protein [Kiritimatiellia bacterium]MCO5067759.1 transglutaminase family protein [Kiritimatiellia bacterium]
MKLIFESDDPNDYLGESSAINFHAPLVQKKVVEIRESASSEVDRARLAFEFARDEIAHSFDLKSERVAISASDAMSFREGICFAKAHVLAALLRGLGIPAGFCYQRVTRLGTVASGHALHGLNAVYLPERRVWFRLDPRGNKPGVNSQFSIEREQLAYPIRPELGEVDYPYVFVEPLDEVLTAMRDSVDCRALFTNRPPALAVPDFAKCG